MDGLEARPGALLRLAAVAACAGVALSVASGTLHLELTHEVVAAIAGPPLVAVAAAAWIAHRRLFPAAALALGLFVADSAAGPLIDAHATAARPIHVGLAALALAAAVVTAALAFRGPPLPRGALRDYITLTKPRVMSLLLVTAACGMFAGAHGHPNVWKLIALLVGGALASGGASALNHVIDRDIDGLMGERTANRPVVAGRLAAPRALEFGLVLSAFSFVLLASVVNLAAASLALAGNLFYVVVYSGWLKRSTVQNIVIGGAAGAVPPVVGYAAATGNVAVPALLLFLIVFLWTPPHFWALALLLKREYAAAQVPMLPVVRGDRAATRQIFAYSLILTAATALPLVWGGAGYFYLAAAVALNAVFIALAWKLMRETTRRRAAGVFHFSLLYLALLFVAVAIDPLV